MSKASDRIIIDDKMRDVISLRSPEKGRPKVSLKLWEAIPDLKKDAFVDEIYRMRDEYMNQFYASKGKGPRENAVDSKQFVFETMLWPWIRANSIPFEVPQIERVEKYVSASQMTIVIDAGMSDLISLCKKERGFPKVSLTLWEAVPVGFRDPFVAEVFRMRDEYVARYERFKKQGLTEQKLKTKQHIVETMLYPWLRLHGIVYDKPAVSRKQENLVVQEMNTEAVPSVLNKETVAAVFDRYTYGDDLLGLNENPADFEDVTITDYSVGELLGLDPQALSDEEDFERAFAGLSKIRNGTLAFGC